MNDFKSSEDKNDDDFVILDFEDLEDIKGQTNKSNNKVEKYQIKSNEKGNNKEEIIYESYENDFTILDNKPREEKKDNNNNYNIKNSKKDNDKNEIINDKSNNNKCNEINKKNSDYNFINDNNNILEYNNLCKTSLKKIQKQDSDISDFEDIELSNPTDKKKEEENKKKVQEDLLLNFYNQYNSVSNNYNKTMIFDKKYDIFDSKPKTCILIGEKKRLNIVKIMAVLKSSNQITWKDNVKSLFSSLIYNGYGLTKTFNGNKSVFPIYMFDTEIDNIEQFNRMKKSFLYFSYRSGFTNLNSIGCGDYTSDCGWGCMVRCSQMILSKGLIKKKIIDLYGENNTMVDDNTMDKIRKETLYLFIDSYLPSEATENHPDFKYFWQNLNNLKKTNSEYKYISEIIPPYSIHILCKLGKCAGIFTSDIKMIKAFSQINEQIFNSINLVHFESGFISKKKLITNFCEKYNASSSNYLDTIPYNGVDYIFKKGGLIFISFRLGLSKLNPNYYDIIPLIFKKIHNNLGFVSGKKNRAYYFIGIQKDDKLIFVDPHYNQQIKNDFDKDYKTYFTDNFYLLDIKDLSSELTLGIGIFNHKQFIQFMDDLKWFNDNLRNKHFITFDND